MTDPVVEPTIFKEEQTIVAPDKGQNTPVTANMDDVFKEHLSSITNEAGEQKYGDVMTALSALKHTQDYVKTLETENAGYKAESVKAMTMDEVLGQLNTTQKNQTESTNSPVLDVETQRDVTLETIRQYEASKKAESNRQNVFSTLTEKYQGLDKAEEAFKAKAEELGMTTELLIELAATSPLAVLTYFGNPKTTTSKFVESSVNTEALSAHSDTTPTKKNIMFGAQTSDIVAAWRAAGEAIQQEQ